MHCCGKLPETGSEFLIPIKQGNTEIPRPDFFMNGAITARGNAAYVFKNLCKIRRIVKARIPGNFHD